MDYLHLKEVRQLLGLVMSLTASCVGDKDDREQEVVVLVHKFPKCPSSSRNHRATTKEDTVHIEEDAHLMGTERPVTQRR